MGELQPQLKTFKVQLTEDGKPRIETQKAFSLGDLIRNFQLMGFEKKQIKVLGELKNEQPVQQSVRPQGIVNSDTGPITLLDIGDVREDVQKVVAENLAKPDMPVIQRVYSPLVPDELVPDPSSVQQRTSPQKIMTWKDGNVEFKLEDGVLSKKVWSKIGLKKLESDHGIKVRFKNEDNKIPSNEYTIEIMEWVAVQQS